MSRDTNIIIIGFHISPKLWEKIVKEYQGILKIKHNRMNKECRKSGKLVIEPTKSVCISAFLQEWQQKNFVAKKVTIEFPEIPVHQMSVRIKPTYKLQFTLEKNGLENADATKLLRNMCQNAWQIQVYENPNQTLTIDANTRVPLTENEKPVMVWEDKRIKLNKVPLKPNFNLHTENWSPVLCPA
jgi:hypothetical protein